jgi:hypothetical protein
VNNNFLDSKHQFFGKKRADVVDKLLGKTVR